MSSWQFPCDFKLFNTQIRDAEGLTIDRMKTQHIWEEALGYSDSSAVHLIVNLICCAIVV